MKKLGLLCMVLVITLGTFGVGYASWSDNLTVEETVMSGTLDVELSFANTDKGATCEEDEFNECGDADISISITSADTLTISVTDAPPSCTWLNRFLVDNIGTIPAQITRVEFIAPEAGKYGTAVDNLPNAFDQYDPINLTPCTTYYFDLYDDDNADLSVHLDDDPELIGQQFDPPDLGPINRVSGEICFHVEDGASENLTTEFELRLEAVPWNKFS